MPDCAELARSDDLQHAAGHRMVAVMEGLHGDEARAAGHLRHGFGLLGIRGKGLLAQNMFAAFECRDGPAPVQPVWQRVIDGVDLRIGDQSLIALIHTGYTVLRGELLATG